jgi:hypothetical protein
MDTQGVITVVSAVTVLAGALFGAYMTRRSTRESNAVTGFVSLTKAQAEEMTRLRADVITLQANDRAVRYALGRHERWDSVVQTKLADAGIEVPDPPPLYPT